MAQGRSEQIENSLAKLPNPIQQEVIDQLQEDLANLLQAFTQERTELENLEIEILAAADTNYNEPQILEEDSFGEKLYEKIAPYFVSANTFLKHILENNKQQTQAVQKNLHELLKMSHAEFSQLTKEEKSNYLLNICFISAAILQDLRLLINKYSLELEFCLNYETVREITTEALINGATTIFFDMALYHPDHAKQFAEYRQQLYSEIGYVDLNIHEFFAQMQGHVAAAIQFVQNYKEDLKLDMKLDAMEKGQASPRLLTNAIQQTMLAPPAAVNNASALPEQKPAAPNWRCTIL